MSFPTNSYMEIHISSLQERFGMNLSSVIPTPCLALGHGMNNGMASEANSKQILDSESLNNPLASIPFSPLYLTLQGCPLHLNCDEDIFLFNWEKVCPKMVASARSMGSNSPEV